MPKYIPVKAISEGLSSAVIKHLISFHEITGCDTPSLISGHQEDSLKDVTGKSWLACRCWCWNYERKCSLLCERVHL